MSAFNDFVADAFTEAGEVFGLVDAVVDGVTLSGTLDNFKIDRSLALGGEAASTPATFMVGADQLVSFAAPLERTLEGKKLSIGDRDYRIMAAAVDECNVTLSLDDDQR